MVSTAVWSNARVNDLVDSLACAQHSCMCADNMICVSNAHDSLRKKLSGGDMTQVDRDMSHVGEPEIHD